VSIYWSGKTTFILNSLQGHTNWQSIKTTEQHNGDQIPAGVTGILIVYWMSSAKKNKQKRRNKKNL
jgi:hypothetical protein